MTTHEEFRIGHDTENLKFSLTDLTTGAEIGAEEYVDVSVGDETHRVMYHTRVADAYGGRGLASRLVRHAVEETVDAGIKIVGVCPYVASWLDKHEEFAQHVRPTRPEHLNALPR